jgi:hypothetical protein
MRIRVSLFLAALLLFGLPAQAAEVITISPRAPTSTDVIHVNVDSFIDCGQQALSPQRSSTVFLIQIVFDPSITNCNIATLHFAFDIGPLDPGPYIIRTVRVSGGIPGLVTDLPISVSAIIDTLTGHWLTLAALLLAASGGAAIWRGTA